LNVLRLTTLAFPISSIFQFEYCLPTSCEKFLG
jgi:hypothetical protein